MLLLLCRVRGLRGMYCLLSVLIGRIRPLMVVSCLLLRRWAWIPYLELLGRVHSVSIELDVIRVDKVTTPWRWQMRPPIFFCVFLFPVNKIAGWVNRPSHLARVVMPSKRLIRRLGQGKGHMTMFTFDRIGGTSPCSANGQWYGH